MSEMIKKLAVTLADTYTLYLKTQNYHWHVKGPQFKSLHELFEAQYLELAGAVDEIAERIRILGETAPATFKEYLALKTIAEGDSSLTASEMVKSLAKDHGTLVNDLNQAMKLAQDHHDEGTVNLLANRLSAHEKAKWMLTVSC